MRLILILVVFSVSAWPVLAGAEETIRTFQQLPFLAGADLTTTEGYINALYQLAIAAAVIIVVLRLMLAGAKLMLSESVSGRAKAKETITSALLGLAIILGAVTILNTINPNLTRTDILRNASGITLTTGPGPTSSQVMEAERKKVKDMGLTIRSRYSGQFGSATHQQFVSACRSSNPPGVLIGNAQEEIVECYR
jgi:hypothetical protein